MTPMLVVPRLSSAPPSTATVSTVLGLRRSAVVSLALPIRALVPQLALLPRRRPTLTSLAMMLTWWVPLLARLLMPSSLLTLPLWLPRWLLLGPRAGPLFLLTLRAFALLPRMVPLSLRACACSSLTRTLPVLPLWA